MTASINLSLWRPNTGVLVSSICRSLWAMICIISLGFPNKYLGRLCYFTDLIPGSDSPNSNLPAWSQPETFSDRGDANGPKTMRQKQQEEWDRLNIAMSVITATSAAALAIQATGPNPNSIYWVVTAFYSAALGMSLQGLIIITYMTISAGGSSDELIGRLAGGKLYDGQPICPVAFTMALPAILATYSSFALLAGLVVMIIYGPGESAAVRNKEYIAVAIIPIAITFLCLVFTVALCEYATHIERSGRSNSSQAEPNYPKYGVERDRQSISTLIGEEFGPSHPSQV
ncbi:unnamed protein product [Rhizoctonia solani]|uniref:Transmembrane protein n=1 Tax=Rhizoctonia solani TaxID=456999 RepID=A0A8H2WQG8_9AGAM|nr:unnamed protein product [Rhizoctonia solani]